MGTKDGIATLKAIRNDPKVAHLPVIVLTTSGRESDSMDTFEHRATYFITRPDDPDGFDRLIVLVEDFARTYIWK